MYHEGTSFEIVSAALSPFIDRLTDMDNKQYQRAVTPTFDSSGNGSAVRGKILSYSNPSSGSANSLRSSVRPNTLTTAMGRPSVISPRPTTAGADPSLATRSNTGKLSDSLGAVSLLSRSDIVPLSEEMPADGIIFAKIRSQPDALVVFRTAEERLRNPERLNLDRRQLESCPLLEQEQRLRLLNYQNNMIKQITNVENLGNLIFLDLYNNQLSTLEGSLSSVKGLRVLMAGKNKIPRITNLQSLKRLDVLDLHSNEIRVVEGLEGLTELRVLNLAGNRISMVDHLNSLTSLTELNLRRNRIIKIEGLEQLPALQRVFLSHNSIQTFPDVNCIFSIPLLIELSLDGNPVADIDATSYRQYVVGRIPSLKHLDLKRVTSEERPELLSTEARVDAAVDKVSQSMDAIDIDAQPTAAESETNKFQAFSAHITEKLNAQIVEAESADELQVTEKDDGLFGGQDILSSDSVKAVSDKIGTDSLSALARAGRLSKAQPIFDIEILSADEKVMIIVGESWEWNAPRRYLSAVTELCLLHVRKECLQSKFTTQQVNTLTSLKTIRFLHNEFTTLKQIEFIPILFGSNAQHLYIAENPINTTAPGLLRAYLIATIPKLVSFNGVAVNSAERVKAEKKCKPHLAQKARQSRQFTTFAAKASKQFVQDLLSSESLTRKQSMALASTNSPATAALLDDLSRQATSNELSFDSFSVEFNVVLKQLLADVVSQLRIEPKR